jgi:hypothetical protein
MVERNLSLHEREHKITSNPGEFGSDLETTTDVSTFIRLKNSSFSIKYWLLPIT